MSGIVVVTGGSAGVGRACTEVFARAGWDVGVIARGHSRLDATANAIRGFGRRACAVSADVADADAIENAADEIERTLGPIDVWVNNATATVFAPVASLAAEELLRATRVTYLGQVHGTMAALRRMRPRNRGTIVQCWVRAELPGDSAAIRLLRREVRGARLHRFAALRDPA